MARGVSTVAETAEEAKANILKDAPDLRVLQVEEIELSDLPPLRSGPLPRHWAVVVEHRDPLTESKMIQMDDPIAQCSRNTRQTYLAIAIDPDALVTGMVEIFDCPVCNERVKVERTGSRHGPAVWNARCPECDAPISRSKGQPWVAISTKRCGLPLCVFCGDPADSREHVVPKWISKRLGVRDLISADTVFPPGASTSHQAISLANFRARIFCTACNSHFKHLEDEAIPVLEAAARGTVFSLGAEAQELLSRWAMKTAIALIAADGKITNVIPSAHLDSLREQGRVPENVLVRYFAWSGGPVIGTGRFDLPAMPARDNAHVGYSAFLTFAKIGFVVHGLVGSLRTDERFRDPDPILRQTWPPCDRQIPWPPASTNNRIIPRLFGQAPIVNRRTGPAL